MDNKEALKNKCWNRQSLKWCEDAEKKKRASMRLWTWQNKDFDIRNRNTPVKSREYSAYQDKPQRRKAFEDLWNKLRNCQFHWYYIDEIEATNDTSFEEYEKHGKVLWELEVSIDSIYKKVCGTAWCLLLGEGIKRTNYFRDCWRRVALREAGGTLEQKIERYEQQFNTYWEDKSPEDLWDCLFLDKLVPACNQILLQHPVDDDWVIKNPLEKGRWWDIFRGNQMTQGNSETLSCKKCPGKII